MGRFSNLEFDGEAQHHSGESDNQKGEAHYLAEALAAFESGNFESGLRNYSKVLEFNPGNTAAWAGQVRMLIELSEFGEARLWADKALERFPHDPEILAAKAVALARTGNLDEALAVSDASISGQGDTPYLWLARADVLLARRERRADYCFDKALLLARGDWFVLWLAARIRAFYEQFVLALKLLEQAIQLRSTHFRLWLELAACQRNLGLLGPARFSYEQAQQLKPDCGAREALGKLEVGGLRARTTGWWRRLLRR